ncbi:transglutaminase domain-containing protein [Candidatus Woesearchaeota archaeon]|nr:transglutaminase domain-containing protein [Candidatus Woesearchaeota archaeon]
MKSNNSFLLCTLTVILILNSSICIAQDIDSINNGIVDVNSGWNLFSKSVTVAMNLSGKVTLSDPSKLEFLEVNLNYFPKVLDDQEVLDKHIYPADNLRRETADHIYFIFEDGSSQNIEKEITYGFNSIIKKTNTPMDIPSTLDFPLTDIPAEAKDYLLPTQTANSDDPKVISLAKEIVEDENNAYVVVSKIAEWVQNNIEYNLTTTSAEASLPASWVLTNRQGVCDEITNLFMALLRSQGIPARFVSGISYTTADYLDSHWGPHGWAEVYFNDVGWVPFDVTYQQYGYVDPTHIVLSRSKDSTDDSTLFRWKEHGSTVEIGVIKTNTSLVSFSDDNAIQLSMRVDMFSQLISFGSYDLVQLEITNLRDSYITPILYMASISDIDIVSGNRKALILAPRETKKTYWLVKTSEFMDRGFRYTVPVIINSSLGASAESYFEIARGGDSFDQYSFQNILRAEIEDTSDNILFSCNRNESSDLYSDAVIGVVCDVVNNENHNIPGMELCLKDECKSFDLDVDAAYKTKFNVKLEDSGINILSFKLSYDDIEKTNIVSVLVNDDPSVSLDNLTFPKEVGYDDAFNIQFVLKKESNTYPKNLRVKIIHPAFSETLSIEELRVEQDIILKLSGSILDPGNNELELVVDYEDALGNAYTETRHIDIELTGLGWWRHIVLGMREFYRWTTNLFD